MGSPGRPHNQLGGVAHDRGLYRLCDCNGNGKTMTPTDLEKPRVAKATNLRRKDWVLLPALSLLTICFLAVSAEGLSRWLYPTAQVDFQNCFVTNDPTGDAAVKP